MITELITLLSSMDSGNKKQNVKLGKLNLAKKNNRIRSISSFSSNSIFYFPVLVGDQISPEEMTMISRMLERSYATFVISCISMIPVHRLSADDADSITDYLSQFHQNLGIRTSSSTLGKIGNNAAAVGATLAVELNKNLFSENAASDFMLECWNRSKEEDRDFIQIVSETVSLDEMFNEDPIDDKTRAMQNRYKAMKEEIDLWGFYGEATDMSSILDDEEGEDVLDEAPLTTQERKRLHKETFGLPKERKYPLNDEEHVRQAIRMFSHCAEDKQKELAGNIKKAMKKFNMDVEIGENNPFSKFINEAASPIDTIRLTLDSISVEKIKNTTSFSKLSALENRLNRLKVKYTKQLNKYKAKYKEHQRSGKAKKEKLGVRFNKMNITDPKAFMSKFNEYMKEIDKKLKAIEKQREVLRKSKNLTESAFGITDMDYQAITFCENSIDEVLDGPDDRMFFYEELADDEEDEETIEELDDILGDDVDIDDPEDGSFNLDEASDKDTKNGIVFDRQIFTDVDAKRANDATPLFTKSTITFVVDNTNETIKRDLLVGIKAYIHQVKSAEMVQDLYNTIINKRKFLKFVKFISGEEKSLADLLFSFKEMKSDAINSKGFGQWRNAFKRRKRMSKISLPYLMKEYTPNGTIVITMNEVNYIRNEYGIDIMDPSHVAMIMDNEFLLGFVVVDQTNELVYVAYDGHEYGFQTYTYAALEREQQNSDRMLRELYRSISR